jgi:hypothetical protein
VLNELTIGRTEDPENPSAATAFRGRKLVWDWIADPIWASGHLPREQAEHMIAVDPPVKILILPLASEGPSVPTAASVSTNVRRQTALIARRDVHHCASLHLQTRATTPSGGLTVSFRR